MDPVLKHSYGFIEWTKTKREKEISEYLVKSNYKVWKEQGKVIYWLIQNILEKQGGWYSLISCNSEQHKQTVSRLQN